MKPQFLEALNNKVPFLESPLIQCQKDLKKPAPKPSGLGVLLESILNKADWTSSRVEILIRDWLSMSERSFGKPKVGKERVALCVEVKR